MKPAIAKRVFPNRTVYDAAFRKETKVHIGRYATEEDALNALLHYAATGERLPGTNYDTPVDGRRTYSVYTRPVGGETRYDVKGRVSYGRAAKAQHNIHVGTFLNEQDAIAGGERWKETGIKTKAVRVPRPKKEPKPRVYKPRQKVARAPRAEPARPVCVPRDTKAPVDRIAMMKAIMRRIG